MKRKTVKLVKIQFSPNLMAFIFSKLSTGWRGVFASDDRVEQRSDSSLVHRVGRCRTIKMCLLKKNVIYLLCGASVSPSWSEFVFTCYYKSHFYTLESFQTSSEIFFSNLRCFWCVSLVCVHEGYGRLSKCQKSNLLAHFLHSFHVCAALFPFLVPAADGRFFISCWLFPVLALLSGLHVCTARAWICWIYIPSSVTQPGSG